MHRIMFPMMIYALYRLHLIPYRFLHMRFRLCMLFCMLFCMLYLLRHILLTHILLCHIPLCRILPCFLILYGLP